MIRIYLIFSLIVFWVDSPLIAQNAGGEISILNRRISPAVPFLRVPADARSSGMGDIAVATSADTYSQQWNPAKYVFTPISQGIGLSYVPFLRKLTDDIHVGQINYYTRFDKRSAFAASIRYFNLGTVESRQGPTEEGVPLQPNQLSVDASYALKLSEAFSMAVSGRYIRSDLKLQSAYEDGSAANAFSVDISGYFQGKITRHNRFDGRWRAGISVSNIGPKVKYNHDIENFLPTNLSIGTGYDFILDSDHTIGAYLQLDKLLVPTPSDSNYDGVIDREDDYHKQGPIEGLFSSFTDAPGGFTEEIKEITWALGAEYRYQKRFAFRAGYFQESPDKGYRQYFTLGAGFDYAPMRFDLSYLFNTASQAYNALDGSLRFSLAFTFGKTY